jgi:acyl carrier protein
MTAPFDVDAAIARYAVAGFQDTTSLRSAGIDSLSLLRLAVGVIADDDAELDLNRLVDLQTIGDLKRWLTTLASAGRQGADANVD